MQLIVGTLMLYISLNVQKLLDDASTAMTLLTFLSQLLPSLARKQRSRANHDFHYACGHLCNSR
jgi:hypothetical protein